TTYKKDELIEALVKQVQQLSVNYVMATNQQERDTRDKEWYSEKGHFARTCMLERKYGEPKEERRPTDNDRRVNYCDYEYDADK
ncbi:17031_t:CDS:2, partial [Cetraspora pellucida]